MYSYRRQRKSIQEKIPRVKYAHPTTFSRTPQSKLNREVDVHVALEKDMNQTLHLFDQSSAFKAVVEERIQGRIVETMSRFETLPLEQRFAINTRAWIRLYLGGECITPKSTFVSDLEQELRTSRRQWSQDYKQERNRFQQPGTKIPTADPSQQDPLHVLFDIIGLIDAGKVTLNEVHQQYDFVQSTLIIEKPNPLLLVLSILHNKMQCRSSVDAPFGDAFVDQNGVVLTSESITEGPGFFRKRNPHYRLITKKCPHGRDCRYLHNAQRICMEYALTGACSYEERHTSMYPDTDGFSMFWVKEDYPDAVCPYAHLCLVCHLIQRQAVDFLPNSRAGSSTRTSTHRVPCHLRSPTEQALAEVMKAKLKRISEISAVEIAYEHHLHYCISTVRESYLSGDYYRRMQEQCQWCHEGGLGEKYPEFPAHMRQKLPITLMEEAETKAFFQLFGDGTGNPDFYAKNDLLIRLSDYLHPWEMNSHNKTPLFVKDRDSKYVDSLAPLRFRIQNNTALFPGMCIPNPKLVKPVSTDKRLICSVTVQLHKFMGRICKRPFTRSDGYQKLTRKITAHEARYQGYTIDTYYTDFEYPDPVAFYPDPMQAFLQLVPVVIALPEYQEYRARFWKSSPLPRHASERWGNIEPAAGVWTEEERLQFREQQAAKKRAEEELERQQAELRRKMEEEAQKRAEENARKQEIARKQAEEYQRQEAEAARLRQEETGRFNQQWLQWAAVKTVPTAADFPPLGAKGSRRRR